MIRRKNRFHGRGSLNFVYKNGRTARSKDMAIKFTPARQEDYRLAVVVSKKVNKSAVVRNRIRRRLYEAFRHHRALVGVNLPYDIILTVYDDQVANMDAQHLKNQLHDLLKRARIA